MQKLYISLIKLLIILFLFYDVLKNNNVMSLFLFTLTWKANIIFSNYMQF